MSNWTDGRKFFRVTSGAYHSTLGVYEAANGTQALRYCAEQLGWGTVTALRESTINLSVRVADPIVEEIPVSDIVNIPSLY